MGMFGGGAAQKKDVPKKAILRLRSTKEMLSKREKYLGERKDDEDANARKYVNTNKESMFPVSVPLF